ncbi:MAG TPA: TIGR03943 family protein [Actinomycetota bacterium]|nr:TIGR03943 family protein [Actinomycetota bacterium]
MKDRRRALRGLVLAVWAAFFGWLWLSGEMTRYLGPRTYWVVVFGSITLGLASAGHVWGLRERSLAPTRSDLGGALLLLLPLVAVIVVPDARLGAQAASRKASSGGFAAAALIPVPEAGGEISFREIDYASESKEYAVSAGVDDGLSVELTGFVTHPSGGPETFSLTRFYVSCCAADAIPFSVPVAAEGGDLPDDTWATVAGTLRRSASGFVLDASRIEPSPPPDDPYLY